MSPRRFLLLLARGASWFAAARVGSALALLGVNALLARLISLEEVGVYVFYLSIVTVGGAVAGTGIGNTCTRVVAESLPLGRHAAVRRAALMTLLASVGAGSLIAALVFWWPVRPVLEARFDRPVGALEAAFATLWLVAFAARLAGGYVYRGMRVMSLAAIYQGMGANVVALLVLAAAYFLGLGQGSLLLTLGTMAGSMLATAAACWVGVLRRLRALPPEAAPEPPFPLGPFLRRGALLALPSLFQSNGREVCVWIVAATAGLAEVALFGAANRLMQVVALPAVVSNQVMQPFIAEFRATGALGRNVRALRLSTAVVFAVMAGLVAAVALFGERALALVFKPEFAGAYLILLWLAAGRLVQAFFGPAFAVLSMSGYERLLARDAFLQFLCLVALGSLLGSFLGGVGVAVAFCLTLAGFAVLRTFTVRRKLGIWLMPELDPAAMADLVRKALRRRGERGARRAAAGVPPPAAPADVEGAI